MRYKFKVLITDEHHADGDILVHLELLDSETERVMRRFQAVVPRAAGVAAGLMLDAIDWLENQS